MTKGPPNVVRVVAALVFGWLLVFGLTAGLAALLTLAFGVRFDDAASFSYLVAFPTFVVAFCFAFKVRSSFVTWRQAMTWLHTWVGLVAGYLLMVIFLFGTLSEFDREIDRWAIPETRFEAPPMPSWDHVIAPAVARLSSEPIRTVGAYRTQRDAVVALYPEYPGGAGREVFMDARNGAKIADNAFSIGSRFIYPMHIHFHLGDGVEVGYWLVGLAAMGMLVGLVSGIVIHRKLVAELFTFRPRKGRQRWTLDLHDVTGVLALPFHFVFTLTGLVVFAGIYLPVSSTVLSPLEGARAKTEEATRGYPREAAGTAAPLASVDAMMDEATTEWGGDARDVGYVVVRFPGDQNASVSIYRAGRDRVAMPSDGLHFHGVTGERVGREPPPSRIAAITSFLTAVHLQPFESWTLRWLYVVGGLSGCVCIATGLIFFVEKRRRKQPRGARWADAFAVATVTGTVVAIGALLVANRVLPSGLDTRVGWQKGIFWATWLVAFVHAAWRGGRAWREQCWGIAALAVAAVVLNAVTTGDHLVRTLFVQRFWPVAGVDLALLAAAFTASLAARRLA